jgi:FkbM family methyltransferase
LLARLGPVGHALDIGANWGQSAYALKRTVHPEKITCFEPSSYLSRRLKRRFAHDKSVQIESVALGRSEGSFELHTPHYGEYVFDGLASLDLNEAKHWLSPERLSGFDPAKLTVHSETVSVRTLDDYELSPEVVKIDVQGAELAVVEGGIKTFRRMRPACVIETPGAELVGLLASMGLTAYHFDGRHLRPDNWMNVPDVVFLTNEHRRALDL